MAFIGNTNTTQAFTPAIDYFSGTGSATAFTLSRPVASVAQVQVTIDNVAQNPSSAYTISGSTITFTSAPLSGTNNIYVYYTSPITQVIAPGQGTVTATSMASSTGTGAGVFQTSPTITTPTISTITSAAATALTLQSAGTTAVTIDTSQNVSLTAAGTVLKNSSGNPILRQSGSVLKVQQFTDAGSTTSSTSAVNLNGTGFQYTPVSTNSTLYLTITAYAYIYPAGGSSTGAYSFYYIGEYNGSVFVTISNAAYLWNYQYSTAYSQSIAAQAYMTCTRSNTSLTARSFDLMGGVSHASISFTGNSIIFTVMEVAN